MSIKNVVLIAGVHGVSGRAAAEHWISIPGTRVYGLSRRCPRVWKPSARICSTGTMWKRKLGQISGITHIVFGAYVEKPTARERSEVNSAILKNLLDVVERTSPSLQHITFYQGGKAYGADLGPFKTPAREDDPRLMPPNFSFDQEDFLRERRQRKEWHWTALRPEATTG
jgi:nucleoside-diphosphate-sugar epimerase